MTELSAALYMTSARYFYNAHEMELFHHDYTHTSGLLGLVKGTSCILAVDLSAGQNFLQHLQKIIPVVVSEVIYSTLHLGFC